MKEYDRRSEGAGRDNHRISRLRECHIKGGGASGNGTCSEGPDMVW